MVMCEFSFKENMMRTPMERLTHVLFVTMVNGTMLNVSNKLEVGTISSIETEVVATGEDFQSANGSDAFALLKDSIIQKRIFFFKIIRAEFYSIKVIYSQTERVPNTQT